MYIVNTHSVSVVFFFVFIAFKWVGWDLMNVQNTKKKIQNKMVIHNNNY